MPTSVFGGVSARGGGKEIEVGVDDIGQDTEKGPGTFDIGFRDWAKFIKIGLKYTFALLAMARPESARSGIQLSFGKARRRAARNRAIYSMVPGIRPSCEASPRRDVGG